jgi:hypothetical protein
VLSIADSSGTPFCISTVLFDGAAGVAPHCLGQTISSEHCTEDHLACMPCKSCCSRAVSGATGCLLVVANSSFGVWIVCVGSSCLAAFCLIAHFFGLLLLQQLGFAGCVT